MKPRDIFQLAVRILGLVFLYHGLMALPTIIQIIFSGSFASVVSIVFGILMIVWPLAVAWWLIGGAPPLMHRAYPETASGGGE
jgi:hypothetical protein